MTSRRPPAPRVRSEGVRRRRPGRPSVERLDGRALLSGLAAIPVDNPGVATTGVDQVRFGGSIDDYASDIRVVIDWGDGTHSDGMIAGVQLVPGASADPYVFSGTHTYASGGSYTITATATDATGAVGQGSAAALLAQPYDAIAPAPTPIDGPVLPLYGGGATFGSDEPDLATAEAIGLNRAILGQTPTASTLSGEVSALDSGTPVSALAAQLLNSTQYDDGLVASYYQDYLGRPGSSAEIGAWVARMQAGMTAEQVADGFLTSAEFNDEHTDTDSFVLALYEDVLDRAPSTSEIAAWTGDLASGLGRATAVADFLDSPEAARRSVQDFYQAFLGRSADAAGLRVNAGLLEAGMSQADLAAAIAGSPEFVGLARDGVG